ncbi:phospholipase A1-like isoform X2 [Belonocnema kinseyi]|uniref:phospholipase A1-like isoform X2 n=1 Tax=Belonocnema kinseyi TaxID=2817044 RepID=UPI00143D2325|nr:phospholipase A1-like isoform X2 [Belonocnema kinseyi]
MANCIINIKMRKLLVIFSLVCALSVVQSYRRHKRSILSSRPKEIVSLNPWNVKSLTSKITPVPSVQPVDVNNLGRANETNHDLSGIIGLGGTPYGNQSGLGALSGGLTSGLDDINPLPLIKFLTDQISFFKDKIMYIYDDQERPVQLKLEIPDFNLLNLWPNLNEKVTFLLYDNQGGNNSFDILKVDDNDALKKSRFNPKKPTVFITHGFLASSNGTSVTMVRDAYLKTRDYNIIAVNWSPLAVGSYTVARLMVPRVGTHIGNMINFLYKNGMNPNTTTLIGHSLGAHVMGLAGQAATQKVNHTIALDPAWPLFVLLPYDQRISHDDAQYVEVIHTNGGLLGLPETTGHYDFYPNGGFFQKGCDGDFFTGCSHSRAWKYLVEQIEGEGSDYYAVECDSYTKFEKGICSNNQNVTIMGALDRIYAAKGRYYLDTNDKEPFGLGLIFQGLSD